ncbi:hypothetical protein MalM25_04980 [Planctomycetes bacterium MalM25]|nr:hypothetical protein MalM25_04980 [Planctomycetes bacterium MalM25]
MPLDPLAPLKTDPKHGHFPWWPEEGDDWVHPEDVATARAMLPSPRVWRRDGETSAGLVVMRYGETRIRVRRTLWITVEWEGYDLGDLVEVRPRGMTNEPHTGAIREMHWDAHAGAIRYQLTLADGTPLERWFGADDLKHVEPPVVEAEVRREPPAESGEELGLA